MTTPEYINILCEYQRQKNLVAFAVLLEDAKKTLSKEEFHWLKEYLKKEGIKFYDNSRTKSGDF